VRRLLGTAILSADGKDVIGELAGAILVEGIGSLQLFLQSHICAIAGLRGARALRENLARDRVHSRFVSGRQALRRDDRTAIRAAAKMKI